MLDSLIADLDRTYRGPAWHGPSLREALESLTAVEASARPVAGAHAIFELVHHVSAWIEVVRRRFEGEVKDEPDDGDFPPPGQKIDQSAWNLMMERLDERQRALLTTVRAFDEKRLHEAAPRNASSSSRPSFFVTLVGLTEHNAYHTGQIMLLRRAQGR
jgi:uncharacterized damage-inducible protein DinB